jgi:hypothetical protein
MTTFTPSSHPISLDVCRLEDILPRDLVNHLPISPTFMPDALLDWWRGALESLSRTPRFATPSINPELAKHVGTPTGGARISVIFCSRDGLEALTGSPESALGMHLLSPADHDAFGEGDMTPRTHRLLVVSDRDEFLSLTADLAKDDPNPEKFQEEYFEAWLATAFHEIAHALVFAENAGLLSPADIERLSDASEISHDIFDCLTGYGIRPLDIDGRPVWADDMDDAYDLMETYVEDLGRKMMRETMLQGHSTENFLDAANLTEDFAKVIQQTQA